MASTEKTNDSTASVDETSSPSTSSTPMASSGRGNGSNRRERKQKFDVKELLNIRSSGGGMIKPGNTSNTLGRRLSSSSSSTNSLKTRRSERNKASATVDDQDDEVIIPSQMEPSDVSPNESNAEQQKTSEQDIPMTPSSETDPVLYGKRKRKRKKFWDEQQSPSSPEAKVVKKIDIVNKKVKSSTTLPNQNNASSSTKKSSKEVTKPQTQQEIIDLPYNRIDLSRDPEVIAKELVEGYNVPGPAQPIPIDSSSLPTGWRKRVVQRGVGVTKGKWEVFIISPNGKSFRSKIELQRYFDDQRLSFKSENFDFSLDDSLKKLRQIWKQYVHMPRKSKEASSAQQKGEQKKRLSEQDNVALESSSSVLAGSNDALSTAEIGIESETGQGVRCSIEKCRKLFRNDRLLQMHIKHYHPQVFGNIKKVDPVISGEISTSSSSGSSVVAANSSSGMSSLGQDYLATLKSSLEQNSKKKHKKQPSRDETSLFKNKTISMDIDDDNSKVEGDASIEQQHGLDGEGMGILKSEIDDAVLPSTPPTFRMSKRRQAELRKKNRSPILKAKKLDDLRDAGKCYMEEYMNFLGSASMTAAGSNVTTSVKADFELQDGSVPSSYAPSEMGASVASEHLTNEEVVNCMCKRIEEDGLMIQCDICLCWQHGSCLGLDEEDQVPDKYVCQICKDPPFGRLNQSLSLDQDWLKEGKLNSINVPSDTKNHQHNEMALKNLSDLMADLSNLGRVLHSLRVKLNVASKGSNTKVFMWSSPWNDIDVSKYKDSEVKVHDNYDGSAMHNGVTAEEKLSSESSNILTPLTGETEHIIEENEHSMMEEAANQDKSLKGKSNNLNLNNFVDADANNVALQVDNLDPSMIPSVSEVERLLPSIIQASLVEHLTEEQGAVPKVPNSSSASNTPPIVPEQKRIDKDECRQNLFDHIHNVQQLVNLMLDNVERIVTKAEQSPTFMSNLDVSEGLSKWKTVTVMLSQDLQTVRQMIRLV